jgi:peptidoglycan/xylan/chitin deacetylase (PgdA/CDA1 family)
MSKVALLLPYKLCGPQGPEIYLQLHSTGSHWRFFGGHVEKNETPLDSIIRETKEELNIKLSRQETSEGWTVPQLISRLRVSLSGIFLFPIEVNDTFPPDGFGIREGLDGRFWPVKALPFNMSLSDKLLIKMWMLRRFVLDQPYTVTPLKCPVITIDLEEPYHYAGRIENSKLVNRDYKLVTVIEKLLAQLKLTEATTTFFCVASTAKKYPQIIREIVKQGHEVASHGTNHHLVKTMSIEEFKIDICESKKIIEDISGKRVTAYRAPAWSWPRGTQGSRYYEALRDAGYICDSSVIPSALIGNLGFPSIPYKTASGIWEFPLPTFGIPLLAKNIDRYAKDGNYSPPSHAWRGSFSCPYSGGLFKRCLGSSISNFLLSYHLKKKGYAMTYIHLRELTGEDASWIRSLDDRYLNLFERWFVGFRTKRFKSNFFFFLAKYSGCSIRKFLRSAYGS